MPILTADPEEESPSPSPSDTPAGYVVAVRNWVSRGAGACISVLERIPGDERRLLQKRGPPGFVTPMKATLVHDYFSDPGWIFESKLDGERCLIHKSGKDLTLFSRNQKKKFT